MKSATSRLCILGFGVVVTAGCFGGDAPATVGEAKAAAETTGKERVQTLRVRDEGLAAARVWQPPAIPLAQANLRDNPAGPDTFRADQDVSCRFVVRTVSGLTPKFYCELPGGEQVKVKYGRVNAELPAEVAATRLLSALGFGADRMYVVRRIRCAGCPRYPFPALECLQKTGLESVCLGRIDYDRTVDFDAAVIERKVEGRKIESRPDEGWAWYELNKIDPARGGSPLPEVDALRLMAVILAHWDNKAENQRLICPPDAEGASGNCSRPLAVMQDLGATFGPVKVDLNNWRKYRVWADGSTCTVSMKTLPFIGATFPDWRISEGGRTLLLGWLEQLSDQQLRDLFEGSRITAFDQLIAEARNAEAWVKAFRDKVQQIRDGGPCPTASE